MKGLQFADSQESCFQDAKYTNMCFTVLQGCRFAISQESRFQKAKHFLYGLCRPARGRLAPSQLSCFQATIRAYMCSFFQQSWTICRCLEIVFYSCEKFLNGHWLLVTSRCSGIAFSGWETFEWKECILARNLRLVRNCVFQCGTFRNVQCSHACCTICLCSGNAYSGYETFRNGVCRPAKVSNCWFPVIRFSGCEMFRYEQCHPARGWFAESLEIRFSGCETFRYGQFRSQKSRIQSF